MTEFPRVARLDAGTVLRELVKVTGLALAYDGPCTGGQVGAAYVRWPDGRRSVLTMTEVNERCRGLLTGAAGLVEPSLYLCIDGPGFCLHEPLARYSRRSARLLAAVEAVGASVPETLAGDDLVHFDFHPENVLVDDVGTVTGVFDWDGAAASSGDFDLYTLRFDLARRAPDLGRWLGARLRHTMAEDVAQACWAHMSLRLVDWSIRHLAAADVQAWLDVAEQLRP